ncbi:MAG TPA: hypothetical protein VHO47_00190 [Candidatus Babeliales bacterium]|nr:hypothetical protein [Candidatus Babeliales bacterium]
MKLTANLPFFFLLFGFNVDAYGMDAQHLTKELATAAERNNPQMWLNVLEKATTVQLPHQKATKLLKSTIESFDSRSKFSQKACLILMDLGADASKTIKIGNATTTLAQAAFAADEI